MDYPLGYDAEEIERLKQQMTSLFPEEFSNLVRENEVILDVGCGTGDIISLLPKGIDYTGVDLRDIVRDIFKVSSKVKVFEGDFLQLALPKKFTFVNFRLVLWSISKPEEFLKRGLELCKEEPRFFIYEPDDSGLIFSSQLSFIGELASEWQKFVLGNGKNPMIGATLPDLLKSAGVENFKFQEKIYQRDGSDLGKLKKSATNLIKIFSSYPGSEQLSKAALDQLSKADSQASFTEKYCYAFRD